VGFQPPFADFEAAVLSVLENFVVAVAGIPRQGGLSTSASNFAVPPPASSPSISGPSVVPTTQLSEESVQAACQVKLLNL
jgi:hypothetical protein